MVGVGVAWCSFGESWGLVGVGCYGMSPPPRGSFVSYLAQGGGRGRLCRDNGVGQELEVLVRLPLQNHAVPVMNH